MRLFLYYFLHISAFVLAILLQVSFIQPLPDIFFGINIIYIVILFLLFFNKIYLFIWWVIVGGFLWDYFGAFPFGVMLCVVLVSVVILYSILTKLLTMRSIYSFLIFLLIGIIIYNATLFVAAWLLTFLGGMHLELQVATFILRTIKQTIFIEVVVIISSVLYNYLFKPLYRYFGLSL